MKAGWTYQPLEKYCKVQNGFAFDSKLFNTKEGTPLIRIRDVIRGFSETFTSEKADDVFLINDGDILIGMDGDFNVGEWHGGKAFLNQRVCKIIPGKDICPRLILYLLPKELKKINDKTTFSTVKHLSSKQVNKVLIPILSLAEQERIVAYLDAQFAKIDAMKANAAKALAEAKALFQSALTEAMTPKEGWKEKTLGEICEIIRGKRFVRNDIIEEGVPCIHYGDIYTYYGLSAIKTKGCISHELAKKMRFALKNDVVVVAAGENPWDIGVGVAYLGDEPAAVHDACFILRHKQNPMFISYYLRSNKYHHYLLDYVHEGKICSFLTPALDRAPFSYPPLPEQERIVTHLDALSAKVAALEANYTQTVAECDALKQALLREVFE